MGGVLTPSVVARAPQSQHWWQSPVDVRQPFLSSSTKYRLCLCPGRWHTGRTLRTAVLPRHHNFLSVAEFLVDFFLFTVNKTKEHYILNLFPLAVPEAFISL